ncbi:MAG: general secretion pathway protein GspB, partial [Burkholderiaceae bacterium]
VAPTPTGPAPAARDNGVAPDSPYAQATAAAAAGPAVAPAPVEHYGPPVAAAPTAARAAPVPVPNINDLPPAVKAELPHLAVGGSIYSEVAAARMVILNGQVFHEGDHPAPDTVVEQIRLKSTVLSTRGQRYEITF